MIQCFSKSTDFDSNRFQLMVNEFVREFFRNSTSLEIEKKSRREARTLVFPVEGSELGTRI